MSNTFLNLEMRRALHAAGIDPASIRSERDLKRAIDLHNADLAAGLAALRQPRMSAREKSATIDRLRAENLALRAAASGRPATPLCDQFEKLTGTVATRFYKENRSGMQAERFDVGVWECQQTTKEAARRVTELPSAEDAEPEPQPDLSTGQFTVPGSARPVQPRRTR